jgi:hypothetical protein
MLDAAIKQIYASSYFTKEQKQTWEDLDEEDQVWENFRDYFIEKYDEEEKYAEATAGKGGLQGINQVSEQDRQTEDDEMAEYLYELKLAATSNTETIQQVNTKTLGVVSELNARIKQLTETVAEQQKTISSQQATIAQLSGAKHQGGWNKAPAANDDDGNYCKNCEKKGKHKPENCWELEENAHKRKANWKSVFEGRKNPHKK